MQQLPRCPLQLPQPLLRCSPTSLPCLSDVMLEGILLKPNMCL